MEITKELLKQKFMEYNKLYFNNELAMCRFTYIYMRDVFGRYMTNITAKGEKIGHISWAMMLMKVSLSKSKQSEILMHLYARGFHFFPFFWSVFLAFLQKNFANTILE